MGQMKDLDLKVSELVLDIAELPVYGVEYLGAVLAERRPGTAKMLLAALELNFNRLEKDLNDGKND